MTQFYKRILSLLLVMVLFISLFLYIQQNVINEEVVAPNWEIGTIDSGTGQDKEIESQSRLRTVGYSSLSEYGGVSINTGYTMLNFVYDASYNCLGSSGWLGDGGSFTTKDLKKQYPTGKYFRVVLRKIEQETLSVDDIVTAGITFYSLNEKLPEWEGKLNFETIGTVGAWQDAAIWDGKLFGLGESGQGVVYNLDTKMRLDWFTLDKKDIITPHANSVCFSNSYYVDGDKYPLLYVNIYNNYADATDRMEGTCCVYRLLENEGQFSTQLVQVIKIGFTEDLTLWKSKGNNEDVRPYGNFVVDTDNDKLYAFVMRDMDKTTRFFKFDLPLLEEGEYSETYDCNVVTLDSTDIELQFDTEYFNYLQGCCYYDGKIISVEGSSFGGSKDPVLRIVDLSEQAVIKVYDIAKSGLGKEPEIICVNSDTSVVYYAAVDGALRVLDLPNVFTTH